MTVPADVATAYPDQFWAVRHPDGRVVIEQAGKRIMVSDELLTSPEESPHILVGEGLVVFMGDNATARYRLDFYVPNVKAWTATRFAYEPTR